MGKKLLRKYIEDHKRIASLSKNQIIITDSDYSKEQMIKYLNLANTDNIHVLYPLLFEDKEDTGENMDFDVDGIESDGYLLFVSANRWHKNNYFAIKAIDNALSKGDAYIQSLKYVVIGLDDRRRKVYDRVLKNKKYFVFKSYTSRDEYDYLMKHARAMVYPSLFEGFGAPPIEAMRQGTVPLCSTSTCIPEISGDAALYFDPYNVDDYLKCARQTRDHELMDKLKEQGKNRYRDIVERQNRDLKKAISIFNEYLD